MGYGSSENIVIQSNLSEISALQDDNTDNKSQIANLLRLDRDANSNSYKGSNGYALTAPTATAVFVDDDGDITVLTKLKDIAISKGIPWTISLFDSSAIVLNNLSETLSLQNDLGWEIAGHSDPDISGYTEQQVIDYAEHITSFLRDKGFILNNYIYSHGGYSDTTQKVLSRYFRSASTTGQNKANDYGSMGMYRLNRIEIPYSVNTTNDLVTLKGYVDTAFTKNQLIVFTTHIWGMNDSQVQIMKDLIDYIKSKNIKITTLNKALDDFAPIVYSANAGINPTDYFFIQKDGVVNSNRIRVKQVGINTFLNSNPLTDFELNMITVNLVNTANATGLPSNTAGTLITYRLDSDNNYGFQLYQMYANRKYYIRKANSDGTWGSWFQLLDSSDARHILLAKNAQAASTVPSGSNSIWSWSIDANLKTGYPSSGIGIVTQYVLDGNIRQEFRPYQTNELWSRYVDGANAWTAWVKISAV